MDHCKCLDQPAEISEQEMEFQRQQSLKAKQAAALGKVTELITEKVRQHLMDEV